MGKTLPRSLDFSVAPSYEGINGTNFEDGCWDLNGNHCPGLTEVFWKQIYFCTQELKVFSLWWWWWWFKRKIQESYAMSAGGGETSLSWRVKLKMWREMTRNVLSANSTGSPNWGCIEPIWKPTFQKQDSREFSRSLKPHQFHDSYIILPPCSDDRLHFTLKLERFFF